jgi:transcription elongation factor Elf1
MGYSTRCWFCNAKNPELSARIRLKDGGVSSTLICKNCREHPDVEEVLYESPIL